MVTVDPVTRSLPVNELIEMVASQLGLDSPAPTTPAPRREPRRPSQSSALGVARQIGRSGASKDEFLGAVTGDAAAMVAHRYREGSASAPSQRPPHARSY